MDRKCMNEMKSPDQAYFRSKIKRPDSLPVVVGQLGAEGV